MECVCGGGSCVSFFFFLITLSQWTCVHICVKRRKREEGKEGAGHSCTTIKTAHVFCFLHVFSFPNYAQTSKSHRKKKKKNLKDGEQGGVCGGGRGYFLFFLPPIQNKASCSLCLALFVCISSYSSGRPCMEGRKKDSSLTAFDVHVLWSHVSALSVKSFCCPSA